MANKKTKTTLKKITKSKKGSALKLPSLKIDSPNKFAKNLIIVILIGTIAFLVAKKYRGQFVAATVNRQPISRFQLNRELTQQYGQLVLDDLINQALLEDLVKQNGVTLDKSEVDQEIANLKEQLGGEEAFNLAISQYGLTLADLESKLELTLKQKKLANKLFDITVTDEEIKDYYDTNSSLFADQTLETVSDDIKSVLEDQKLQEQFTPWFQDQKDKASIQTYL